MAKDTVDDAPLEVARDIARADGSTYKFRSPTEPDVAAFPFASADISAMQVKTKTMHDDLEQNEFDMMVSAKLHAHVLLGTDKLPVTVTSA